MTSTKNTLRFRTDFHRNGAVCALAIGLALAGDRLLAQSATIPGALQTYGTSSGATLRGVSTIHNGQHQLELRVTGAFAHTPCAILVGTRKADLSLGQNGRLQLVPSTSFTIPIDGSGAGIARITIPGTVQGSFYAQALPLLASRLRSSNGLSLQYRGQLSVHGITPASGREGDRIVLTGRGFEAATDRHCIMLPGGAVARVLSATSTRLVAQIGPIARPAQGDVVVAVGIRRRLPTGRMRLGGIDAIVRNSSLLDVTHEVPAGVRFRTLTASAQTSAVTSRGEHVIVTAPDTDAQSIGWTGHLALWGQFRCYEWNYDVSMPTGFTPAQGGGVVSDYVRLHVPVLDLVQNAGRTVTLRPTAAVGKLVSASGTSAAK